MNYRELTSYIYGRHAWGPLFRDGDLPALEFTDSDSSIYIEESLDIMGLSEDISNQNIFNIGVGRESIYFQKKGAKSVTYLDICKENTENLKQYCSSKGINNINITRADIQKFDGLPANNFDVIFMCGIYQHIKNPSHALARIIKSLKPGGKMYMGFYRSGEWKYFVIAIIRLLIDHNMFAKVKKYVAIIESFGKLNHYQISRLMDDFFIPCMHKFHPNDIVHDIKKLGASVFYFDNDFRDYNHESDQYFSIGGDRIYITKTEASSYNVDDVIPNLKTFTGKDQINDLEYKESIIYENIATAKNIRMRYELGEVSQDEIILLAIKLYDLTRPYKPSENEYYMETKRKGRHKVMNEILNNFSSEIIHNI